MQSKLSAALMLAVGAALPLTGSPAAADLIFSPANNSTFTLSSTVGTTLHTDFAFTWTATAGETRGGFLNTLSENAADFSLLLVINSVANCEAGTCDYSVTFTPHTAGVNAVTVDFIDFSPGDVRYISTFNLVGVPAAVPGPVVGAGLPGLMLLRWPARLVAQEAQA